MNKCTESRIADMLLAYQLGMLSHDERGEVEIHLLECPVCFERVKRFEAMGHLMREDSEARDRISRIAQKNLSEGEDHTLSSVPAKKWWTYTRIGLAAAAAVILFLFIPWELEFHPGQDAIATPSTLLVLDFDDHLSDSGLGEIVASLLITDLSESEHIQVVSHERLYDIQKRIEFEGKPSDSSALMALMTRYADARWVLTGEVIRDNKATAITYRLADLSESGNVSTQSVTGEVDEPVFGLVDRLTVKIKNDLPLPSSAMEEVDPHVADVTTHYPKAYALFLEGLNFFQKMYLDEATNSFEACLEIDSTFAMAYYHLAEISDRRQISNAVRFIDHAGQRDRYFIKARESEYLYGGNDHVVILEELLNRFPGEKEALLQLNYHAYRIGNYAESIRLLLIALTIDPLCKRAYNQLSYSYDANGEFDKAIETLDNYSRIAPDEANPHDTKGDLYARQGLINEAIASYRVALDKKPDFWASQKNLGHMYVFRGEYARALELYNDLIENTEPTSQTASFHYPALALMRQGRLKEALVAIDTAIAQFQRLAVAENTSEPTTPHHIKALIYHELGQLDKAAAEAEICMRLIDIRSPGNAMHYRWVLAHYLAEMGDYARADSVIKSVREYYRDSSAPPTSYYRSAGVVALARHESDRAAELLESALSGLTPTTDYLTYTRLGQAYLEAGNYVEAIAILEQVTTVLVEWRLIDGVYGVKCHYFLGLAYEGVGEIAKAQEQYRTFLDIWKDADPDLSVIAQARERLIILENGS